jgi:hypothetical protein
VLDEFPTLEAAALLGVVILALRTYLLLDAVRSIPPASTRLVQLLSERDRARAIALCSEVSASGFSHTARQLLQDAEGSFQRGATLKAEVQRELADALERIEQRNQSARARDLVMIAILLGATLYAAQSTLKPSPWFFGLCILGASFMAVGFALRKKLLAETRSGLQKVALAIAEFAENAPRGAATGPCLYCEGVEHIVVPGRILGQIAEQFGLGELRVCKACGFVQGQVEDPQAIPISTEYGTSVVTEAPESGADLQNEEQEHEG